MSKNHLVTSVVSELSQTKVPERLLVIFWLLGPFVFLIERSPADIWLSILSLSFLILSVIRKDWHWTKPFWVRSIGAFFSALLLTSILSSEPATAIEESLLWVRFPLFAIASAFWLSRYRACAQLLIYITTAGLCMLMAILFAEIIFHYDVWSVAGPSGGRLTWPYGDTIPGNYLAKFGALATVWLAVTLSSSNKVGILLSLALAVLLIIFVAATGERINTIITISILALSLVWLNFKRVRFLLSAGVVGLGVIVFAITRSDYLFYKFSSNLVNGAFNLSSSGYHHLWQTGLAIFETSPLTGIGVGMFRHLCHVIALPTDIIVRCDNHPHQYYVQALAETGLIGFGAFVIMVVSIIYALWYRGRRSTEQLKKVLFVVPLALFFPLQSTADLFGQWVNLMMWFAIGHAFALSYSDLSEGSELADGNLT